MGTTTNLALPYPELTDPADVPADIKRLADRLDLLLPEAVTSLPASPVDGQEVYYVADATAGVVWHLRYRAASASASKWELVGGPPLRHYVAAAETFATSNAWTDAATVGPQLTLPLRGDYDLEWGAKFALTQINITQQAGVALGATNPTGPLIHLSTPAGVTGWNGGIFFTAGREDRRAFNPADNPRVRWYSTNGSNVQISERWLLARPVRVG